MGSKAVRFGTFDCLFVGSFVVCLCACVSFASLLAFVFSLLFSDSLVVFAALHLLVGCHID